MVAKLISAEYIELQWKDQNNKFKTEIPFPTSSLFSSSPLSQVGNRPDAEGIGWILRAPPQLHAKLPAQVAPRGAAERRWFHSQK